MSAVCRNYITGEDLQHFLTPAHAEEAMKVFDVDHNNKVRLFFFLLTPVC